MPRIHLLASAVLVLLAPAVGVSLLPAADSPTLTIAVMDPLAAPLACACVKGYAQRDYDRLGKLLETKLGGKVRVVYAEALSRAVRLTGEDRVDLIIGKDSVVKFDLKKSGLEFAALARLTGKDGKTTLKGLFVVPSSSPARKLSDIKGYRILFGPEESEEKHAAATMALRKAGIDVPKKLETRPSCSDAALDAVESDAKPPTAAVISSYALALLEGCQTIEKGELRLIGETSAVPFIAAFVRKSVTAEKRGKILKGLLDLQKHPDLLHALESRNGFVEIQARHKPEKEKSEEKTAGDWPGWRGPHRDGIVPWLPEKLPAQPQTIWKKKLSGSGLAGVAATEKHVVVADRDPSDLTDIFRCLRADTGEQLWQLSYPAPGELDFGNSARAAPLVDENRVYLLGAFGHLHCVNVADGAVIWKKNIVLEFGAKLPTWGVCASPLIVNNALVVNPGASKASVVALDKRTGKVLWKTPGHAAAYSSFIVDTFGGLRQIVGYDEVSLGGWDPTTGKRLWQLVPSVEGDYNVPTPIEFDGKVLVTTENNGTRLYGFDSEGAITQKPAATNEDFAPDTASPVVLDGLMLGCAAMGELVCLDLRSGLKTLWTLEDEAFDDYTSVIGSSDKLLVTATRGELLLLRVNRKEGKILSRLQLFGEEEDVYSHPAMVGHRLYVRGNSSILCVSLDDA